MLLKFGLNLIAFLMTPVWVIASLVVGIGKTEITPPIESPSAGYARTTNMIGVHDPLYAIALFIETEEKQIAFCSVDHLGFNYEMVQKVIEEVHSKQDLSNCEIYIASSHTHSGGGGYLNIPVLGEHLAGPYNANLLQLYVKQTARAIIEASKKRVPAKIGIGYGSAQDVSRYRGVWPVEATPLSNVTVIKVTSIDDSPLAVLFNYPVHPTILDSKNLLFSADFVGYAREYLAQEHGQAIYFNGAQGDIVPYIENIDDRFASCDVLGKALAETVQKILQSINTKDSIDIKTNRYVYSFKPQSTPFGLTLPIEQYDSEINLIVFDKCHAFVTIPGELSCFYDRRFKELGKEFGYRVSVFGLVNDAHGYIIPPNAFNHTSIEARLSFGGKYYAEFIEQKVLSLLKDSE